MILNPGDPCRVRLQDGRVVEAVYDEPAAGGKHHWVIFDGELYQTVGHNYQLYKSAFGRARFVGSPCVLEPV